MSQIQVPLLRRLPLCALVLAGLMVLAFGRQPAVADDGISPSDALDKARQAVALLDDLPCHDPQGGSEGPIALARHWAEFAGDQLEAARLNRDHANDARTKRRGLINLRDRLGPAASSLDTTLSNIMRTPNVVPLLATQQIVIADDPNHLDSYEIEWQGDYDQLARLVHDLDRVVHDLIALDPALPALATGPAPRDPERFAAAVISFDRQAAIMHDNSQLQNAVTSGLALRAAIFDCKAMVNAAMMFFMPATTQEIDDADNDVRLFDATADTEERTARRTAHRAVNLVYQAICKCRNDWEYWLRDLPIEQRAKRALLNERLTQAANLASAFGSAQMLDCPRVYSSRIYDLLEKFRRSFAGVWKPGKGRTLH